MRPFTLPLSVSAIALSTLSAYADIAPEDVWNMLLDASKASGRSVSAELARDGDMLVATDIELKIQAEDENFLGGSSTTIARIEMTPLAKDRVQLVIASPVESKFSMADENDNLPMFEQLSSMSLVGAVIVSGSPNDLEFDLEDGELSFETSVQSSEDFGAPVTNLTIPSVDVNWTSKTQSDRLNGTYTGRAERLEYTFHIPGSETPKMDISVTANDYTFDIDYDLKRGDTARAVENVLLDAKANLTQNFGSGVFDVAIADEGAPVATTISGAIGGSETNATLSDGLVSYSSDTHDISASVTGPRIPVQNAEFFVKGLGASMSVPMGASDALQTFGLALSLEDLGASSEVWAMLDPTGQLSQTPASFKLDLSGDVLFDTPMLKLDPTDFSQNPPKLGAINLNELFLSLAGATLEASGNAVSQDGPSEQPNLVGAADIKLTKVTDLIDSLTKMGLLPPEYGSMSQMMLGMLARPGEAPGELVSHIERTADGQILANGLPLPF